MRAANGGRSGRLRMPVQETASTQIAARILADVKSQLSAEHASKAAAAAAHAQAPSPASGTLSSGGYHAFPRQIRVPQVVCPPSLCFGSYICLQEGQGFRMLPQHGLKFEDWHPFHYHEL